MYLALIIGFLIIAWIFAKWSLPLFFNAEINEEVLAEHLKIVKEQIKEELYKLLAEKKIIYENTGHLNKKEIYLAFTKTHLIMVMIDNPIENWYIYLDKIELKQNKGIGFYLGLGYDIDLIIKFEADIKKISLGFSGIKYTSEVIKNIQDLLND